MQPHSSQDAAAAMGHATALRTPARQSAPGQATIQRKVFFALLLALCCTMALVLGGCADPAAQAKDDLDKSLQALISGNEADAYLYQAPGASASASAGTSSDAANNSDDAADPSTGENLTQKIMSACTYEMGDVTLSDDKSTAKVALTITAPDTAALLQDAAQASATSSPDGTAGADSSSADAVLSSLSTTLDQGGFPTKDFSVNATLYYSGEHWMLDPSKELSNALSGGLMESYFSMGQSVVDALAAEG